MDAHTYKPPYLTNVLEHVFPNEKVTSIPQ